MTPVWVYGLCDELGGEIWYIGKSVNPLERWGDHIRDPKDSPRERILRLLKQGQQPVMVILEVSDEQHWEEAEKWWIAWGRKEGWSLVNIWDGGQGADPGNTSLLWKQEGYREHQRQARDENYIQRVRESNKRTYQIEEVRNRAAVRGRTSEGRERRRQRQIANWEDPSFLEKQRLGRSTPVYLLNQSEKAKQQWANASSATLEENRERCQRYSQQYWKDVREGRSVHVTSTRSLR